MKHISVNDTKYLPEFSPALQNDLCQLLRRHSVWLRHIDGGNAPAQRKRVSDWVDAAERGEKILDPSEMLDLLTHLVTWRCSKVVYGFNCGAHGKILVEPVTVRHGALELGILLHAVCDCLEGHLSRESLPYLKHVIAEGQRIEAEIEQTLFVGLEQMGAIARRIH